MKTAIVRLAWVTLISGLLFATGGCSDPAEHPMGTPSPEMKIQPRVSVGEIKAGMTAEDVVKALGQPERKTSNALEYTGRGFAIMPGQGTVQIVMCGDVTGLHGPLMKTFNGKTAEGIGLNSTAEQVVGAYGQPDSRQAFAGGRESLRYDNLGITFSTEAGKVHHMIVRLTGDEPPQRTIEIQP